MEANPNADPSNPFYGKAVVFTGDMEMPRAEAAQAVAELGAHVKSAVSRNDGLSGRGRAGPGAGGRGRRSGKEEKAAALNESGQGKIEILDESRLSRPAGAGAQAVSFVRRLLSGKNVRLNALSRVRRQLGHPMRSTP